MTDELPRALAGLKDMLPADAHAWHWFEAAARELCARWGFREIRTPAFEASELFVRSVGGESDIVQKEMYSFEDRSGRSVTLRPEGTAPVVRAYLEHSLGQQAGQTKVYYLGPMFRHDRPQEGRQRQFHQLGVEVFGAEGPAADADIVLLWMELHRVLGITGAELLVNTIGDDACRPAYLDALRAHFAPRLDRMCEDCRKRHGKNVLRLLDCKQEGCRREGDDAPRSDERLCAPCAEHWKGFRSLLDAAEIRYAIDPRLVRGLDYYTRTVFEVTSTDLGAQDSLGGGGRYDGLVSALGGSATPGVGWAIGIERTLLVAARQGTIPAAPSVALYVAALGEAAEARGLALARDLRASGFAVEVEYRRRSLKAQLRSANDAGAAVALILGDNELARGVAAVKRLAGESKGQDEVPLADLAAHLRRVLAPAEAAR